MRRNRRAFAAGLLGAVLWLGACSSGSEDAELVPVADGVDDTTTVTGDEGSSGAATDEVEATAGDTGTATDGSTTAPADDTADDDGGQSAAAEDDDDGDETAPPETSPDAGAGDVDDQDLEGPGPDNELTETTVDLDTALEAVAVDRPCDLYSAAELGAVVRSLSDDAGLVDDLPPGLLPANGPVAFEVDSDESTSCGWFSETQIWALEISWQAADGSFAGNLLDRGTPLSGVGDAAALDGDTIGHVVVGDLLVSFSHLPPGHTATSADRDVLVGLMSDTVDRLGG